MGELQELIEAEDAAVKALYDARAALKEAEWALGEARKARLRAIDAHNREAAKHA